jgi:hypothetical protein
MHLPDHYKALESPGLHLPNSYKEVAESLTYSFRPDASPEDLIAYICKTSYIRSQKEIQLPTRAPLPESLRAKPFAPGWLRTKKLKIE